METIKSIYYYTTITLMTLVYFVIFSIVWFLTVLFDRNRVVIHDMSRCWSRLIYGLAPGWKVTVEGLENIDPKQTYVVIANHQSMLDIPLLYALPFNFKWVSKREVYKMPVFGWVLWMHGDIAIERGGVASTKKMIKDCGNYLNRGVSVIIFPEGTRTKTGRVGRFKEGAFMVAKTEGYPILQVVTEGTGSALKRGSWKLRMLHTYRVRVLEPISREDVAANDIKALTDMCQVRALENHKQFRPELYKE